MSDNTAAARRWVTADRLLVLLALLAFVLAAFHVSGPVDLVAAGLAFLAASMLI